MSDLNYTDIIRDQADRALWEVNNVIHCVPDGLWDKCYCDMPLWKHIYHMLHSLDQWYINPGVYTHPTCHTEGLNNLDVQSSSRLSRKDIELYFNNVQNKIKEYNNALTDDALLEKPENCKWPRFALILGQHRHLHSHMGMLMGFIIAETGMWPKTVGLVLDIPDGKNGVFD